uniref:Uncharacterized protein n=1 Tax=Phragmatopoma lapidosa TaxID=341668 RepID=D9IG57_9ANNE|nr:hypothetical protein [Phragmatopoma lapidosa]
MSAHVCLVSVLVLISLFGLSLEDKLRSPAKQAEGPPYICDCPAFSYRITFCRADFVVRYQPKFGKSNSAVNIPYHTVIVTESFKGPFRANDEIEIAMGPNEGCAQREHSDILSGVTTTRIVNGRKIKSHKTSRCELLMDNTDENREKLSNTWPEFCAKNPRYDSTRRTRRY